MLQELLGNEYTYVTFDDFRTTDLFHSDPEQFMRNNLDRVIFDEVQRVPEIFSYIKRAVDQDRKNYGKFVVTGSSQFLFIKKISESLAGRIGLLKLLPLQFTEVPQKLRSRSVYSGSYPELVTKKYEGWRQWYSSYLETYINRDVRELSNIGNLRDFRQCVQLLAARTSQLLNMSEIAKEVGVTVATIKHWISVLEASYIIFLLPSYHTNRGKQIVKSPKVFFFDTGLAAFLTKIETEDLFEHGPLKGALFENYVVAEVMKNEIHKDSGAECFFYRTNHGVELDLVVERKRSLDIVEVKSSETFRSAMLQPFKEFAANARVSTLVYRGETLKVSKEVTVQNYAEFLAMLG
jgi:hypothetical protein